MSPRRNRLPATNREITAYLAGQRIRRELGPLWAYWMSTDEELWDCLTGEEQEVLSGVDTWRWRRSFWQGFYSVSSLTP